MTHFPPCVRKCYINYLQFFCSGDLPLLPCLFIYLIVYLYHYRLMEIFCILWVNSQYCIIYFVAQALLVWLLEAFSAGPYFPLPYLHHWGFEHFLHFWYSKTLQAHFVCFLLQPWDQALLQGDWFLFLDDGIRKQAQGTGHVCFFRTQLTNRVQGYTCMFYLVYGHTPVYTAMCNCL